jgi:O-acetyl-ADP-ribose deacetylase
VGPIHGTHRGAEAKLLAACYRNSLTLAVRHSLTSIAFPAISTGIYDYPRDDAASVSSQAIQQFLAGSVSPREVRLVFFEQSDAEIFLQNHRFK